MTHQLDLSGEPIDIQALDREVARMRAEATRDMALAIGRGIASLARSASNVLRFGKTA